MSQRQQEELEDEDDGTGEEGQLPSYLQFRPTEELITLRLGIESALDKAEKRTESASHLQTKQEQQNVNLPLVRALFDYVNQAVGDSVEYQANALAYVLDRVAEQGEEDSGLPDDLADELQTVLARTDDFLGDLMKRLGKPDPEVDGRVAPPDGDVTVSKDAALAVFLQAQQLRDAVGDLVESVLDLAGGTGGGEEDEDEGEEAGEGSEATGTGSDEKYEEIL